MICIHEKQYDYVIDNGKFEMKISKKIWEQLRYSKPGEKITYGSDTFIFYKDSFGIKIQKTCTSMNKNFVMNTDLTTWQYIKDWIRCHDKRKELTEEYIKNMSPEEIKKRNIARFTAQFETPEYKAAMEKRRIEYEKRWAEECEQTKIFAQEKEKARQEMIERMHNDIMSGACELPFTEHE